MVIGSAVNVLESTSALVVFALLVFWLIPNYRLDLFRQEVFRVRDELFDYARAGHIEFGHPAYVLLRQSANGFIRYAHRLTVYRVVLTGAIWKLEGYAPKLRWTREWNEALASLDERTRQDLTGFHERIFMLVTKRLILGSPLLIALLILTVFITICRAGLTSIREAFRSSAQAMVASVIDTRLLEEEAAEAARAAA